MVRSIGLDIVETARVEKDIARFGERFIGRLLGERERPLYDRRQDRNVFLSGRLAAKEAIIKGLAPFLDTRPALSAIQVVNDASGAPEVVFPEDIAGKLGNVRCLLSITHERTYAAAVAVFEEIP